MTQHDHRRGAQALVGWQKRSTERWRDAKEIKKVVRHNTDPHALGIAVINQDKPIRVVLDDGTERRRLRPIITDFLDREEQLIDTYTRHPLVEHDNLPRVRVRQGAQDD